MSRPLTLALLLVGLAALAGCKKDQESAASPGPTVIVEQPGQPPAPVGDEAGEPSDPTAPEFGTLEVVTSDVPCSVDADCVKGDCCHATSCVAIADAPDCSAAVCTLECRGGTMDCYGGCLCQDGFCAARLWTPPPAP